MKWLKSWLVQQLNGKFTFSEEITFDPSLIKSTNYLLGLKDVHISGDGFYDRQYELLMLHILIKGVMIVPCALSLEPVDYIFETTADLKYSFNQTQQDDEIIVVKGLEIDIIPVVWELISLEIPFKVIKTGATIQSKGEGWEVKSETIKSNDTPVDPRLAKLNDYFKKQ